MGSPIVIATNGYGTPVVVLNSGGAPVTISTNGFGLPVVVATNGFGIPITYDGGNVAPILTWTSASTVNTPTFSAALTNPLIGDIITLQAATDSGFSSIVGTYPNTVDAGEQGTLTATFTTGPFADGTYYFRAKHNSSAWSNTVTVTIAAAQSGWFYPVILAA